MASLSETAKATQTAIKIGVVVVLVAIVTPFSLRMLGALYRAINPPPPPAPTVGFGKLPQLEFPDSSVDGLSFSLETVGGEIPSMADSAKVYLIRFPRSGFLDIDRAKQKAASLGFVLEPEKITDVVYRWTRTSPLAAVLDLDTVDDSFEMNVSWETDPGFLSEQLAPTEAQAITEAKGLLKSGQFLRSDLDNGVAKTQFLAYKGGKLVDVLSLSEADFVEVDLFRASIIQDQRVFEVTTPDPDKGVAEVLISSSRGQGRRVVSASYRYTNVEYEQFQTYPVISGGQAWQLLQQGYGYVASYPENGDAAVVRRVKFGYYDSLDDQKFMQPIYIFEGDEGFVAYVPAVNPEYLLQTEVAQ